MDTDAGTGREPGSLRGDVEPSGRGAWLTLEVAEARLSTRRKTLYRRARRGQVPSQIDAASGRMLIWVPEAGTGFPGDGNAPGGEPRSLAVPEHGDQQALAAIERAIVSAIVPLHETIVAQQARIELLIRENERLSYDGERRSRWWEPGSWLRRLTGSAP